MPTEVEEFFGVMPAPVPGPDEERMMKDGNKLIQQSIASRNRKQEYARSQVRDRRSIGVSPLSLVDWGGPEMSGFSGAAHSPAGVVERKTRTASRRSSLQHDNAQQQGQGQSDQEGRRITRSHRHSSIGPVVSPDTDKGPPTAQQREAQKYRNRRHAKSVRNPDDQPTQHEGEDNIPSPGGRVGNRGRDSTETGDGIHNQHRRAEKKDAGTAQRQILSPSGRIRRPVVAAAASTTFEVTRKGSHRTAPGKMKRSDRGPNFEGGPLTSALPETPLFQKGASIKW
jgi:hypothetical protein